MTLQASCKKGLEAYSEYYHVCSYYVTVVTNTHSKSKPISKPKPTLVPTPKPMPTVVLIITKTKTFSSTNTNTNAKTFALVTNAEDHGTVSKKKADTQKALVYGYEHRVLVSGSRRMRYRPRS